MLSLAKATMLAGLAVEAGNAAGGISPTTTIVLGLITTAGAVLCALIARLPVGRRLRRSHAEGLDEPDVAVPLEAYNAMRDHLTERIEERDRRIAQLEHELLAARRKT